MAICPFAKQEIIPPGSNDPYINARLAILHVAVSMAESIRRIFLGRSGIEAHFYINWRGKIVQYRDTSREADANLGANDIAISIETAGFGSGKWNKRQLRSIKRLLRWLHRVEGIPLRVPDNHRDSGVGYHVQFGAPGGWTTVAKSCPGPERIQQYRNVVVPWMNGDPSTTPNEPETTKERIVASARSIWKYRFKARSGGGKDGKIAAWAAVEQTHFRTLEAERLSRQSLAATRALAKGFGKDVEDAVEKAIKDAVIDVDVTVKKR